jgi:hypothetical protein
MDAITVTSEARRGQERRKAGETAAAAAAAGIDVSHQTVIKAGIDVSHQTGPSPRRAVVRAA